MFDNNHQWQLNQERFETMKISSATVLACVGILLLGSGVQAQTSTLDLVLPQFELREKTFLEALKALKPYGIQVGVELKPAPRRHERKRFNISLRNAPLRVILDTIVRKEGGYSWREVSRPYAALVNIFPTDPELRFDELLDLKVSHFEIKGTLDPTNAVHQIRRLAPELSMRGGTAGSYMRIEGEEFWLIRDNLTVRELLNEIVLQKRGLGWVFRPTVNASAPQGFYYSWNTF